MAYSPGFLNSASDTKPTLASLDDFPASRFQYRPAAETQVTTATTASLSGADWWTVPADLGHRLLQLVGWWRYTRA